MALDKDILGVELYNASVNFNDANIDTEDAGAMEEYRLNFWKAIANKIIEHITASAVVSVNVTTTGTATAQTGTGTGTIA
jgi:hypothetical protein